MLRDRWKKLKRRIKRYVRVGGGPSDGPDSPGDPYAYVTAPKRPRPGLRSAAVAEEEP